MSPRATLCAVLFAPTAFMTVCLIFAIGRPSPASSPVATSASGGLPFSRSPMVRMEARRRQEVLLGGGSSDQEWPSLEVMHERYTSAFVAAQRFGISRMETMQEPEPRTLMVNGVPHSIARIELVGLLDQEPVFYDSAHRQHYAQWIDLTDLPSQPFPHRLPASHETEAVRLLRNGEPHVWTDIAVNGVPSGGTLTAPLRADMACLQCHAAEPGDLLGAFQYRLAPPAFESTTRRDNRVIAARLSALDRQAGLDQLLSASERR